MAKKKNKPQEKRSIFESNDFKIRKALFQIQNMDRDIRDRDTNYILKVISKGIAIIFTISFGIVAIHNYLQNIPISNEIKIGIPLSASFTSDFPNTIINLFKKTPP